MGVVAAEMPAAFEPQALEAQAVAARTYALASFGKHDDYDLCADSTCCQAYRTIDEMEEKWKAAPTAAPGDVERYTEKLRAAISSTRGQALVYEDQLIQAVFHSSSYGQTLGAQEVWGSYVPYLSAVPTPETPALVPQLASEVTYSMEEFTALLKAKYPAADLSGDWDIEMDNSELAPVSSLRIANLTLTGAEARSLFSLRSTTFTVEKKRDSIVFHVLGYGHGVGMSQYGANLLALEGYSYQDILAHYYPGSTLVLCSFPQDG